LLRDLVRCQKIVGVEPLDVVASTKGKGVIPCSSRALMLSRHNEDVFRGKSSRNR
jgi:hypothetical protein